MQKQEMMDKHTMERWFLISFYRISSGLPMIKPYPSFISIISIIWYMIYVHILSLWYGYDLGKSLYFRNLKCWAIWGCRIMTYPLRTIIPHWGRTTWVRYNLSRNDMLVGGYNPSEKYESQLGRIIPYIMEKTLKPPARSPSYSHCYSLWKPLLTITSNQYMIPLSHHIISLHHYLVGGFNPSETI